MRIVLAGDGRRLHAVPEPAIRQEVVRAAVGLAETESEKVAMIAEELGEEALALRLGRHLREPAGELPGLVEDHGAAEVARAELLADHATVEDGEPEATQCLGNRGRAQPPAGQLLHPVPRMALVGILEALADVGHGPHAAVDEVTHALLPRLLLGAETE
jgi:hypothetical protein